METLPMSGSINNAPKENTPPQRTTKYNNLMAISSLSTGGKLLASIMLGSLAVGVGGALIGLGTVFLPVYGSVCLYRRLKLQRNNLNRFQINSK